MTLLYKLKITFGIGCKIPNYHKQTKNNNLCTPKTSKNECQHAKMKTDLVSSSHVLRKRVANNNGALKPVQPRNLSNLTLKAPNTTIGTFADPDETAHKAVFGLIF